MDNGLSRRITREETKDILQLAADAGLVHAVSNRQQDADTICNCCSCSCVFLELSHVLQQEKSHDFSNYRVKITQTTCKACGLCVERCPVRALTLADCAPPETNCVKPQPSMWIDVLAAVCVHKCPTRSLILEHREEICHPPEDGRERMRLRVSDHEHARADGPGAG